MKVQASLWPGEKCSPPIQLGLTSPPSAKDLSLLLGNLDAPFCLLHLFHPLQGDKNHGFEVLYHCVKQGPVATKELADFIRER